MRTILVPVPSGFRELFERAIGINSMTLTRGEELSSPPAELHYLLQTLSWAETLRTCARLTVQEKEGNRCRPDDHVRSPASGSQWIAVTPGYIPEHIMTYQHKRASSLAIQCAAIYMALPWLGRGTSNPL